jgi:ketosteroid isomerase-like protein
VALSHESVELLLRGYRAFVAGDLAAMEGMLDPDVEWVAAGEEAVLVNRDRVLEVLAERVAEDYHVTVDRAFGLTDRVVVSMRFSRVEADPSDDRPLQSRRSYLLGRWAGIVHMEDGRVVRVEEFPHLEAALEAAGVEGDGHV